MRLILFLAFVLFAGGLPLAAGEAIQIRIVTEQPTSEKVVVGYTAKFTMVGEMKPEITVLARLSEGDHALDVSSLPEKTDLLYFICPGFAPQWIQIGDSDRRPSEIEVQLFQTRYVTLRYADDPGGPDFSLTKGDEIVATQFSQPDRDGAWQIIQGKSEENAGTDIWIRYWQLGDPRWGMLESHKSFDEMTEAPTGDADKYREGNFQLKVGSKFYFKNTQGYSKLEVISISTERPKDAKILEFTPTFKDAVAHSP